MSSTTDVDFITDMLYGKDIAAYVSEDWGAVDDDFDREQFVGYVTRGDTPMQIAFGVLEEYRDDWLGSATDLLRGTTPEQLSADLHASSRIADISFNGKWALVRKEFDGYAGVDRMRLEWVTHYHCRKDDDRWRIVGFHAIFPASAASAGKRLPEGATQHATAGPYSPVLIIPAGDLVAISGQGPLDGEGNVVGDTIEEQTAKTLENCQRHLATAGCTLDDVFKVTVHLKDLDEWARFNEVYKAHLTAPYPTRTTTGTDLLLGMRVEIDMLARRP
jgi:enamine deaminase RidA (YjgF/YER057c/UK114 family)